MLRPETGIYRRVDVADRVIAGVPSIVIRHGKRRAGRESLKVGEIAGSRILGATARPPVSRVMDWGNGHAQAEMFRSVRDRNYPVTALRRWWIPQYLRRPFLHRLLPRWCRLRLRRDAGPDAAHASTWGV